MLNPETEMEDFVGMSLSPTKTEDDSEELSRLRSMATWMGSSLTAGIGEHSDSIGNRSCTSRGVEGRLHFSSCLGGVEEAPLSSQLEIFICVVEEIEEGKLLILL